MATKNTLTILLLCLLCGWLHAQPKSAAWCFNPGQNNVYLADLAVDTTGCTYAAFNYGDNLTLPVLNKKLPNARHMYGLIVKLDKKGTPLWAHAFKSGSDNRIKDIAIAPNGDLLITGFGDVMMEFPGHKDTLRVCPDIKKPLEFEHNNGFYAARYAPNGDRRWVHYLRSFWGEGIAIAANKKGDVYLSYFCNGAILNTKGEVLDTFGRRTGSESQYSLACFDGNGKLKNLHLLHYDPKGDGIRIKGIKFDHQDNMLLSGSYTNKVKLSPTDSLTTNSNYESDDSYIAKYTTKMKLQWFKKIGGQGAQSIESFVIAADNSVYATGRYDLECLIGDNITTNEKSIFEWKSGSSLFYFHLFEDGEPDFVRFQGIRGDMSYLLGTGIAIDQNNTTHILGSFNDTLAIEGHKITAPLQPYTGFYSQWKKDGLVVLEKMAASINLVDLPKIEMNKGVYAVGTDYADKGNVLRINGKDIKLNDNEYGRGAFIYGGKIPDEKQEPESLAQKDDVLKNRLKEIKTLLSCTVPGEKTTGTNWFPVKDIQLPSGKESTPPCGEVVAGMSALLYPNPTSAIVNIQFTGIEGTVQLDMFSASGSQIMAQQLEGIVNNQVITFNVEHLSNGVYTVRIRHNKYEKALRFVKTI